MEIFSEIREDNGDNVGDNDNDNERMEKKRWMDVMR